MNCQLTTIEDVKDFVTLAAMEPHSIDIVSGKYRLSASSIMGVFSLDLSSPFTIVCNEKLSDKFLEGIQKYLVKD